MGFDTRTNDWQVCMVLSIAAGAYLAAGTYRFDFYSQKALICARFKFFGFGLGAGLEDGKQRLEVTPSDLSGTALPIENVPGFSPWSDIECDRSFSVWDLNGSWGRLSSLTVGAGATVGPTMITAAKPFWKSWFHSQDVGGFGTGAFGASGEVIIGHWDLVGLSQNRPGLGLRAVA
jgi:hypothetical protein